MAASTNISAHQEGPDNKPNLSFWNMISMSFGFLGIQYGFGLQQANMSPIYRYLGAEESSIPGLWLAGPLTGLLLQPIIGAVSDRSWSPRWGRRKPYIFIGAIVGSIAMVMMPNSKSVFMAACLMWMLDAGLNSAMEPFRAFVGDLLNNKQRPTGFAIQSFMVGFGQTLANLMPFLLPLIGIGLAVTTDCNTLADVIPNSVRYPFYIGAAAILLTVFLTMYTTKEYPPENDDYKKDHVFTAEQHKSINYWHLLLTGGAGLLSALFAFRLGYLGKITAFGESLKMAKWNEIFGSLQNTGADVNLLNKVNDGFKSWGVSHEKLSEISDAMKCKGVDLTRWNELTAPFVSYCKEPSNFAISSTQTSEFLINSIPNGLIWGSIIFALIYLIFKLPVFKEILASISEMPPVMRQLWWVKFFTWYGLPLMWQYLSLSIAKYSFDAISPNANPAGFEAGSKWGSLCLGMFSVSCFVISIFMPVIVKSIGSRRLTHATFLTIGAMGFFLMLVGNDKWIYFAGMTIVGLAWGSIMSLPYLMLAGSVSPSKMGVYMGIFNGFICIPQFIGMLTVPLFYKTLLGDDPRNALVLCGICFVLAAISCFRVKE